MLHRQGGAVFDDADMDGDGRKAEATKRLARVLRIAGRITSQPHYWRRPHLAAAFEVSERSIDRDLEMLRGLGYEITHSKTDGYAFARTPALPPVLFSLPDVLALTLAAELARDSGDVDTASLGAALAHLLNTLPKAGRPLLQRELERREKDARSNVARRAMLELVQRARLERRQARIVYATAMRGGAIGERVIEPYAVYPYERSWMVTAYDHYREKLLDFKIDRIHAVELLDTTYTIPTSFDLAAYRGQSWGIMRGVGGKPVSVELLFDEEGGRWVQEERRTEPLTFEPRADGQVLVRLATTMTPEFVRWIIWYGPHCRVLAPEELRATVRAALRQTLAFYDEENVPVEEAE